MSSESIVKTRRGVGGGIAFVVCGPSGAGKNSVIERVMQILPGLSYSVSYTTRPRRSGEVNGKDYYYITHQEFDRLVSEGEMVEHVTYLGDQYGTSRAQICEVFSREKDVILNIDVEGAKTLKGSGLLDFSVIYVFLTPSSLAILGERLRIRGTEDDKEIRARLTVAAQEMETLPLFDYLVVNDELDIAVDELRSIIVAERSRILHG
ncbi:guanylate kinase [Candidatus Bipolaricaulota bacterium]|jgi:guanylate kinase|nr:guanylate kinase [Candidatus Bipolaricaulota bacterium]